MSYSMPYTKTTLTNGEWFIWNANGIVTNASKSLAQYIGQHKRKLLTAQMQSRTEKKR